jgi:hypothetical protein
MEDPAEELKADPSEREEPPAFEELSDPSTVVEGGRTRDDFFDAVLGLTSPATAREVADLAGHGVDAAREYLQWFERMGIVRKVTDSPATYQRNQAFLNWRRVQSLRESYTTEELLDLLETATERDESYTETFGVDDPDDVSLTRRASETEQPITDVWEDLSAWKTTRRRMALLERALRTDVGDSLGKTVA